MQRKLLVQHSEQIASLLLIPLHLRQILQQKAKLWNISLSEKLEKFLLSRFPSNPILALQALALRSQGTSPTIEVAEKILADLLKREQENTITPEILIQALSVHFGIKPEDILGKSQMREYALPRQIAMYLCREKLQIPFQAIGKLFARDHSTVMSSVKQIQKGIDEKKPEILNALARS